MEKKDDSSDITRVGCLGVVFAFLITAAITKDLGFVSIIISFAVAIAGFIIFFVFYEKKEDKRRLKEIDEMMKNPPRINYPRYPIDIQPIDELLKEIKVTKTREQKTSISEKHNLSKEETFDSILENYPNGYSIWYHNLPPMMRDDCIDLAIENKDEIKELENEYRKQKIPISEKHYLSKEEAVDSILKNYPHCYSK